MSSRIEQLALGRDPDQLHPPLSGQRHPGRVVERRDGVDELGRPPERVELVERAPELVDPHAVAVHLDLDDLGLVGAERGNRAGVRGGLADDHVARVDQRLAHEVDDLLAACGHEQLVGVDLHPLGGHHLANALLDDRQALSGPVLQSPGARLRGHATHQRGIGVGREGGRVRPPSGQRNHLRALGQRHQVAHGRGAHRSGPAGEQRRVALDVPDRRTFPCPGRPVSAAHTASGLLKLPAPLSSPDFTVQHRVTGI